MARSQLSDTERRFLADPPRSLARIATVDADGAPHVVPGGWSFDPGTGEIVLGGRDVPSTRRAGHVRASGLAAMVVDEVTSWGLDAVVGQAGSTATS